MSRRLDDFIRVAERKAKVSFRQSRKCEYVITNQISILPRNCSGHKREEKYVHVGFSTKIDNPSIELIVVL